MNSLSIRQKQIIDFGNSAEFKDLNAFYSRPSIFNALGVSRNENTHSNFLAWFLTPKPIKNDHGLGDMPLRKFLETLALACTLPHSVGKIAPELANAITAGAYTLSETKVEREKHIGIGRLDIYISGYIDFDGSKRSFKVIIENKVKSSEHDFQTERYLKALRSSVSRADILLSIFLTPLSNREYERLDAPTCEAKEFIELNYQYLADYVIEPCRAAAPEGSVKQYLSEYLLALGQPETRQDKGDIIMAISKEEQDLLSRFWEKHKELLTAVMLSIGDYVPLEGEEAEIVQKASQAIQNAIQRDLTRFSWQFSGGGGVNRSKRQLVQEVIAYYALINPGLTVSELCLKFPGAVESLDTVKTKSSICYNLRPDELIKCADGYAAIYNQWRKSNIKEFISNAKKLGFIIDSDD